MEAQDVYADLTFPRSEAPGDKPYVAINMVSTLDGRVSVDGKASPIGSGADRLIMRNIRCAADAVLVGAGTVRAEEMNLGVPKALSEKRRANGRGEQPLGVILAGSGGLPFSRKILRSADQGQRIVVIAADSTPEATLLEASALDVGVLRTEDPGLPQPASVLRLLNQRFDTRAVLLEGGPAVNASFLSSGAVEELFLTLSPKIFFSATNPLTLASTAEQQPHSTYFDLVSVYASSHEGELYLRYVKRYRETDDPS